MGESEITDRLKRVREHLGLAQKDIAGRLEVAANTYSSWESGRTAPNALYLERLCGFGINGHWLLTGKGPMLLTEEASQPPETPRKSTPLSALDGDTPASPLMDPKLQETVEQLERSGLSQALLLSRRGRMDLKWQILKALSDITEPASPQGVRDLLERSLELPIDLRDVLAEMTLLEHEGLLSHSREGFQAHSGATLQSTQREDYLQGVREVIAGLGREVLPAILRRDGSGGIKIWETTVEERGKFLFGLRSAVNDFIGAHTRESGERLTIYLCAGAEDDPNG